MPKRGVPIPRYVSADRQSKRRKASKSFVVVDDDDFQLPSSLPPLPAGPSTYAEISKWPIDMLHRATLSGEVCTQRMQEFFGGGLRVNGDYSGYDCPREMLTQLWKAMALEEVYSVMPTLTFARSCDNAKVPQQALLYLANEVDGGKSCVATDIEKCLTQEATNKLNGFLNVAKDVGDNASFQKAFAEMLGYLLGNLDTVFKPGLAAPCEVHGCECPHAGALPEGDSALSVNFAGTTCVGWSTVGLRQEFAHVSERTHAIWLSQRAIMAIKKAEHGFFQECTHRYPVASKLQRPLKPWFFIVWIKLCGTDCGFPSKRLRIFSFGGSLVSLVWCGPSSQKEIQADFFRLFRRRVCASGDVYFRAPPSIVDKVYRDLLKKRHMHIPADVSFSPLGRGIFRNALTAQQAVRLAEYEEFHADAHGRVPPSLMVDVFQNVHSPGDTSGTDFPSQLKHGLYYSYKARRAAVGLEGMVANGWHIFETEDDTFSSALSPFLKSLPECVLKGLSGNGMSMPPLCAWVLYVALHTRRREEGDAQGTTVVQEEDDFDELGGEDEDEGVGFNEDKDEDA